MAEYVLDDGLPWTGSSADEAETTDETSSLSTPATTISWHDFISAHRGTGYRGATVRPAPTKRTWPELSETRGRNIVAILYTPETIEADAEREHANSSARNAAYLAAVERYRWGVTSTIDVEAIAHPRKRKTDAKRVKRDLTDAQRAEAMAVIAKTPVRACYDRAEWQAEVWAEFAAPSALVSRREARLPMRDRVRKAINRAQGNLRRRRDSQAKSPIVYGHEKVLENKTREKWRDGADLSQEYFIEVHEGAGDVADVFFSVANGDR